MRLIDADALMKKAQWFFEEDECMGEFALHYIDVEDVEDAPNVDAAPVIHARWGHLCGDEWCCTACGNVITTEGSWKKPTKKYCYECGAKMDGGKNNG